MCFLQGPGPIDNLAFTSGDTPPPRKGLPLVPYVSKQVRECKCVSCLDTMISHCIGYCSIVCVIKLLTPILVLTIAAEILDLMFFHLRRLHLPHLNIIAHYVMVLSALCCGGTTLYIEITWSIG